MEIIKGLDSLKKSYPNTVLTIGNYDSVHLGHKKILSMLVKRSQEIHGTAMVMTFEPHPIKVLAPEKNIKLLTTPQEKARLIEEIGVDFLLAVHFTKEFSQIPAENFIEQVLVKTLQVKEIIIGSNYSFGKNKRGNVELLSAKGKQFGFSVKAVGDVKVHGHIVSSSTIRALLLKGAVNEASHYLGRPYSILGTVIKGKGRGKAILNIPTANITTPVEIAPKEGVYAVKVDVKGDILDGVANIGKNPTFGNSQVSYEVHIFNFSGNLLGESLRMYFIDRLRGERTFPDATSLEKQIRTDIAHTQEILSKSK
jgi:riboflavin kinase/FMN adenylyltransferase